MPEYTAIDPYVYNPEIYSYLHGQPTPYVDMYNPKMELIITMVMQQPHIHYGTTINSTMEMLWTGKNTSYINLRPPSNRFNPYEDISEIPTSTIPISGGSILGPHCHILLCSLTSHIVTCAQPKPAFVTVLLQSKSVLYRIRKDC
jgi:hypothetical protein